MENKLPTIGFLGSGAITTALVTGLCERAADAPYPLVVSDAKAEACEKLRARFPGRVTAAATLQECVDQSGLDRDRCVAAGRRGGRQISYVPPGAEDHQRHV